jgi:glycosyltransferase involved in cell wall biosynthesis
VLVDHVTFSKTGGAGEVASLLAKAQNDQGIDARLLTLVSGDLKSEPFTRPLITVAAALDEYLVSNHSSPTILSLYRSRLSQLNPKALRSGSVVHLHWLPGVLAHEQVRKLLAEGRIVVWTLHDMAPFTGVCHHSHGCSGFQGDCSNCPQVRPMFRKAVELSLSGKAFDKFEKNLVLVAPTLWMAKQARASSLFRNQRIEVIENPIRPEFFFTESANSFDKEAPNKFREPGEALVLTAVASDLTNPAKGIAELVKIFKEVAGGGDHVRLQLVGGRGRSFHNPEGGIYWLGMADASELVRIARETHLLVSASTAESAGLIVREFGALSVPTLALRNGGIDDMIRDKYSGLLVNTLEEMQVSLSSLSRDPKLLEVWGERASELSQQNRQHEIVLKYLDLYSTLGES